MPTPRKPTNRADDSLPLYDGSYYMIVTRTVEALRERPGARGKLEGLTHGAVAMGKHTQARFRALSALGRLLASLALVAAGAAAAMAIWMLVLQPDPDELRARIRAHLAGGDVVAARADLELLQRKVGTLSRQERRELAAPVQARIEAMAASLRAKVDADRKARRWDQALETLDRIDELGIEAERTLFTRAEVTRVAGRDLEAATVYARYRQLYPETSRSDDALFWQALVQKTHGNPEQARSLLNELLATYPRSDFTVSSRRILAELAATASAEP